MMFPAPPAVAMVICETPSIHQFTVDSRESSASLITSHSIELFELFKLFRAKLVLTALVKLVGDNVLSFIFKDL